MHDSPSWSPMAILDKARKAVPAVNYALGIAGIAAAAAMLSFLVGNSNSSIILISSSFVGMILLFIFSKLVVSSAPSVQFAGVTLVWVVLVFFATFLVFTTTAFVLTWPCNWARVLGVTSECSMIAKEPGGPAVPSYYTYASSELDAKVVFPNNILTLDNTERAQQRLLFRAVDGRPLVVLFRSQAPAHKNVKQGQTDESANLIRMNATVDYKAPQEEENWSNWYVLSGLDHGIEYYYRRWYCQNDMISMEFRYTKDLTPLFDQIIPMMTRALEIPHCFKG